MSSIDLLKQIQVYDKPHCFQYQKKLDTYEEDKLRLGWTDEFIKSISLDDYEFSLITTVEEKKKAKEFIQKYEWLGTLSQFNTHYFKATFHDEWACVVIFSQPNSFSKMLGENTPQLERLISRGASTSWATKGLASKMISWCIHWMVENTTYRLFTAYSDPQAKERGTIYRALNFYYLGQGSGTSIRCVNPYDSSKIISDRTFRARSFYKRYAKDLGIEWQKNWNNDQSILWDNIPDDIEQKLRDYSKEMYNKAEKISFPKKRKWAYVLGKDKRETKLLRKQFLELNKVFDYPND